MDIASMIRPALTRITSSITTTANMYDFTRVFSFTGSFNDRTSLLIDAPLAQLTPPPSQPHHQEVASASSAVATVDALSFDIEAATPAAAPLPAGEGQGDQEVPAAQDQDAEEAKRVAKSVQTVCLFVASASLALFVKLPAGSGGVLYNLDLGFICLGLFTSLGLSMFSIVSRSSGADPAVARAQKRVMCMAVGFVLASFTLLVCMKLPTASPPGSGRGS